MASKIEVGASPQIRRAEGGLGPLEAPGEDVKVGFAILLSDFELEPGKVHKYARIRYSSNDLDVRSDSNFEI